MRSTTSALAAAALAALLAAGCGGGSGTGKASAQGTSGRRGALDFPVEVSAVRSARVEYAVDAVGSVEAFERVEVTARVAGAVERVLFREGEYANAGRTLVEIEPQRYRLAVAAAEANLKQAEAQLAEAEAGRVRRESANAKNPGLIRGEEVETWRTKVETARAVVSQYRAALDQAKLNLHDALVRAPVSGTIQTRTVQTGQYVQPGAVLATLIRRDPLLLRFQVPEQDSKQIRPGMIARFTVAEASVPMTARISHVAAAASSESRMVDVTANVDDPKSDLKPGAFARVVVPIGANEAAPVIPQTAIRPSERGFLAYVVEGGKARERILTLGMRTADGSVEVRQGLRAGELLVVRGAEALRDGAGVKVSR